MRAHYSPAKEANALLPPLPPLVAAMLEARRQIVEAQPELWPVLEKSVGNGGSPKDGELVGPLDKIQRNAKAIEALGVRIKDLNAGLLDFLSERDGREVRGSRAVRC